MEIIRGSQYKNKASIVLENDWLRAEFTPDPGAKLVSLVAKESGYEFLVQRPGETYREQPFGGHYTDGECSGFDDMFPTIDGCAYHKDPWKGIQMADHGEVWSLPWDVETQEGVIHFSVAGVRFPYLLQKQVQLAGERTLRFSYTLVNNGPADFDFLWAGHFMLNIEVGTQVLVPDDCKEVISILTNTGREYGERMAWPMFKDEGGKAYRADISRPESSNGFEKYYFTNKLSKGWCELRYPRGDKRIRIGFSAETVPYLGILMNENGWDGLYNIFVEPCTVCYDRPDTAEKYGQVSRVKAGDRYTWAVDLTI